MSMVFSAWRPFRLVIAGFTRAQALKTVEKHKSEISLSTGDTAISRKKPR
jgi:hypothetical protein